MGWAPHCTPGAAPREPAGPCAGGGSMARYASAAPTQACTHIHTYAHTCTRINICTCIHMHTHTHACTHAHTYTLQQNQSLPSALKAKNELGEHRGALPSAPASRGQGGGPYRLHTCVASDRRIQKLQSWPQPPARPACHMPLCSLSRPPPPSTWVALGGGSPAAETTLWSGASKQHGTPCPHLANHSRGAPTPAGTCLNSKPPALECQFPFRRTGAGGGCGQALSRPAACAQR